MPTQESPALDSPPHPSPAWSRVRWWICGLLFLATTINYIDRQIIGVLKSTLQSELHWSEIDYSNVVFWFQVAYAAGYLFAGRLMDLIGVRFGYTIAVIVWSIAAMSHAAARSVLTFSIARFGLGLAEGGNFPAAVKTVSEWFPRKERALATGLFNAGSNLGPIVTPLVVPWITHHLGWPSAFFFTGAIGFAWVVLWFVMYRHPDQYPGVSPAELEYIRSDPPDPPAHVPWVELLGYRTTWAFMVGMFFTSPVWWFYLYWVPGFLNDKFQLNLLALGPPLIVIYLIADLGSIGGGWLSSRLIHHGWNVNTARKFTLLLCALCVLPVFFASRVPFWPATLLIALAAAAHQGWSANLYTLVSDTMPRRTVSSVIGIGGMAGAVAGMGSAKAVGYVLEWTHSYALLFGAASSAYLIALFIMHLLLPTRPSPEEPAHAPVVQ